MPPIYIQYHKIPYGELILGSFQDKLCLCDWRYRKMRTSIDSRIAKRLEADYVERDSDTISEAKRQLAEYFAKTRQTFEIPLLFAGSEFQQSVWTALQTVEYGTTATYLQLSQKLQNPQAVRAVASANGANALSILTPCHRIIGSNGELVGYAGGLPAKRKLLELEQSPPAQQELDL